MALPKIKSLSELDVFINEKEEFSIKRIKSRSLDDFLSKIIGKNDENDENNKFNKFDKFNKYIENPEEEKIKILEKHGLDNSFKIIPSYYMKNGNLLHINFYEIIIDDIRNMRKLNEYQFKYIKESCDEYQKLKIIELFNECLSALVTIL